MEPQISVIIPVRNAEPYLEECLDSVLAQSYGNLQIICVEDGSSDASADILQRYAREHANITVAANPESGVSAARNHGLELATGEWIVFLDADDALHPHAISILLSAAARASAQVATAGYQIVNEIPKEHRTYSRMKVGLMSGESAMCHALFQTGMDNSVWGKIFASTLFNEHLRFRPGRFEDLDIIYRIYDRARRVAPVDATLYYYRKNPEGFMGRLDSPGRFDALEVTDRIIQYTAMYPQRVKKAARARYLAAAFNALGLMVNNNIMDPRLEQECLRRLRRFRHSVLFTKSARRKDRLGALVAYLPAGVIKRLVKKS